MHGQLTADFLFLSLLWASRSPDGVKTLSNSTSLDLSNSTSLDLSNSTSPVAVEGRTVESRPTDYLPSFPPAEDLKTVDVRCFFSNEWGFDWVFCYLCHLYDHHLSPLTSSVPLQAHLWLLDVTNDIIRSSTATSLATKYHQGHHQCIYCHLNDYHFTTTGITSASTATSMTTTPSPLASSVPLQPPLWLPLHHHWHHQYLYSHLYDYHITTTGIISTSTYLHLYGS